MGIPVYIGPRSTAFQFGSKVALAFKLMSAEAFIRLKSDTVQYPSGIVPTAGRGFMFPEVLLTSKNRC